MSAAITATVVGGAIAANQAKKGQAAQKKAGEAAMAANAGAMAGNAEWTQRGSEAANRLQMMMGLGGGEGETYESLAAAHHDDFLTFVPGKKKKKKGFLKKAATGEFGLIGALMSKDGKAGGSYVFDAASQAKLDKFVNDKLARNKAMQEDARYGSLMKRFSNDDFVKDPGYDWRMKEGQRGVDSSAAARGGLFSGAAGKEMNRYTQGFASNEFGLANDRYVAGQANDYNRLAGIAGTGQSAQNMNSSMVRSNNDDIYGQGNLKAAGYAAKSDMAVNALNAGANYWNSAQAMKRQKSNDDYNKSMGYRV